MPDIYLTWGPVATVIVVPAVGWFIKWSITRVISTSDKLHEERHINLVNKLDGFCKTNREDHEALWDHHNHHQHDDEGRVTFTG